MVTRRQLLAASAVLGASAAAPQALRAALRSNPVAGLASAQIPKYVAPLFIPPAMPLSSSRGVDSYEIAVRQFAQQVLPPGMPTTQVFGYGAPAVPASFHYPTSTIEAQVGRPVRVTWRNELVTRAGDFRPHLLPLDPTLHWANPPGGTAGRDSVPEFTSTPGPYRGPVPTVTHLHGAHVTEESDGYPAAWFLPAARNIPAGYATTGSFYDRFRQEAAARFGVAWAPGSAVYQYPNDQAATEMWFHSHELGATRLGIYSGQTGLYMLRGGTTDLPAGVLPGPAPGRGDPSGTRYYEIPLIIQCRSFNSDGSLFFPSSRGFFGDVPPDGPFIPNSDIPPIWNPEFFGTTIVVNGQTWPSLTVEPRRYRLRLLNASNTRVLMLKIVTNPLASRPAAAALPMWVIGADGGFLPAPVAVDSVPLAVAERADVIVDLTGIRPGTKLYLINEGPDEPFGGGQPGVDFAPADPNSTGQVMQLVVGSLNGIDRSTPPAQLKLPSRSRLGTASRTRRLSLNEMENAQFDAPTMGMLGTVAADGTAVPLHWGDPVTEAVTNGSTEIWELHNFTEDAHPIHVHLVQFEVLDRRPMDGSTPPRGPLPWETGTKDTVVALPDEITRIKARFDVPGRFVWHCHIIDHEDNEMMRPYQVS